MSRLFQGAVFQQARAYSQKRWSQVRTSPPKEPSPEQCQPLCAEKKKMLDVIQDSASHWKKNKKKTKTKQAESRESDSSSTSGARNVDSCCRDLCREKTEMMSAALGGLGPRAGDEGDDGPPCAVLTSVRCGQCGYTFCCTCSPTPWMRRLRTQYWSRPQDKYTLCVSLSIYEKVFVDLALLVYVCE